MTVFFIINHLDDVRIDFREEIPDGLHFFLSEWAWARSASESTLHNFGLDKPQEHFTKRYKNWEYTFPYINYEDLEED